MATDVNGAPSFADVVGLWAVDADAEIAAGLDKSSVWKITRIIEALAATNGTIGVREASRVTGLDKSAASRILAQLHRLRFVERDPDSERYAVGPRLFALGAALVARDNLVLAARPILEELTARFNETTYLTVRHPRSFTFRIRVDCSQPIRHMIDLGYVGSLHAGAGGRAILAGLEPDEAEQVLADMDLAPRTDNTITDPDRLRALIAQDRARGASTSYGETVQGSAAVASPYFDANDRCAGAVVIARPLDRQVGPFSQEMIDAVKQAADTVTLRLGGHPRWVS